MLPHVHNRSFRDLTKGSIPYGTFVGTLLWETPRTPQRAGMPHGCWLPSVARSSQDLESEVGTHVGRPFVPSTPNQGFMRCPDGFWGMLRISGIMATHIPACEAHTAVYTFGPDILCCLTFGPDILCIPACEAHTAAGYSSHLAALLPISLLVNSAAS